MIVAAFGIVAVNAQQIPERKRDGFKPLENHRDGQKKEMADLNLSEEQKLKFKSLNDEFRKQMEDLRKQDNITVKESREKMETLHKEHEEKVQSLLTADQKAQLEKNKQDRGARVKEVGGKRDDRMKQELNLTEEQSAKIAENRKGMAEKMKAIREDKSLTDEQKKEKSKELMKTQKEKMKSILTEEQLQKMKEQRKGHPGKKETK